MNWLDWTPKASNIEKGCPQALPKPPKPIEEPTFGGFGSTGATAFSINKGSGSPSDGRDGLSPTSESVDRSQQAPESSGRDTTSADSASDLLPTIPTIEPCAQPQPDDDWEDL
jgi:hypothetical protein